MELRARWVLGAALPPPVGGHIVAVRTLFAAVPPGMVARCIDEDICAGSGTADVKSLDAVLVQRPTQTECSFGGKPTR